MQSDTNGLIFDIVTEAELRLLGSGRRYCVAANSESRAQPSFGCEVLQVALLCMWLVVLFFNDYKLCHP